MLVIPNLSELPFHRIEVVLSVPFDQLTKPDQENCLPRAFLGRIQGEREVFVSLELCNVEEMYAALSLSFDKPNEWPQFWQSLSPEEFEVGDQPIQQWEKSNPDSIWRELDLFLGKQVDLLVEAKFSVGRAELQQESLVASMIGLRTVSGEEQFLLSGAQFSIRGFPEDTVAWYVKPGSNGGTVSGQLVRQCTEQFNSESLSDAMHVLEARFNRVVRAQSNIKSHATS